MRDALSGVQFSERGCGSAVARVQERERVRARTRVQEYESECTGAGAESKLNNAVLKLRDGVRGRDLSRNKILRCGVKFYLFCWYVQGSIYIM